MPASQPLVALLAVLPLAAGCSMPTKRATDPMSPLEQLLTSEAIAKGLADLSIDLEDRSARVFLEATGLTRDQAYMGEVVRGFLGRQGFEVEESLADAEYRVQLIIQSLGTVQSIRLFGLPASRSSWLPISIPELALYKRNREDGYVRFYFDVFDQEGNYIRSTRDYEGAAHQTSYTVFFVFDWASSDLPDPIDRNAELTDPDEL